MYTTITHPVARTARELVARLLRFPLFYKMLIANSLLVTLGAFAGTFLTIRFGGHFEGSGAALALVFTIIGVALTITLNSLLLSAAMRPLRDLRGTVTALGRGDFNARVPASPLADEDLASVASMLNEMLDHVQRYQERVQDLSAGVLRAQEDERARIARELHDQIGQALTFLLVRLKIIEAMPQAEAVQSALQELRAAVADTIDQVRRLALDLRPPALDQLGLVPALRALARDFAERTRISAQVDLPEGDLDVPLGRATAIYRVVQESLTNIAKHAEAHTIIITLTQMKRMIHLRVTDDGCGFDPRVAHLSERRKEGPGLGLFGMEERVRLLGGTLQIESQPECGTTIRAVIPCDPLESPHGPLESDFVASVAERASDASTHPARR
jgi:two-component system sensor histidine kinase UhpB